jgi:hypothetical protein
LIFYYKEHIQRRRVRINCKIADPEKLVFFFDQSVIRMVVANHLDLRS